MERWTYLAVLGGLLVLVGARPLAAQQSAPQNPWSKPNEGRAAAPPTQGNCSGSITEGDGTVTTQSTCPPAGPPQQPVVSKQFPYPGDPVPTADSAPSAPASSSAASAPAGSTSPDAPAGTRFPYPGDAPATPAGSAAASPASSTAAGDTNQPAGKRFPYPGEPSATPGPANGASSSSSSSGNNAGGLTDAGSSGVSSSSSSGADSSSSSSGSSSSSAGAGGADVPSTRASRRAKLPPVARQAPSEREDEDVKVGRFYANDGNYKGAYDRALDAVSIVSDDPEAHCLLADAARRLGKLDEAASNYHRCLALDPVPKVRKDAERALKEMSGGGG